AAELFAERGVAATSLDEVLAAAGAGKSQLYHYFRGRDELVEAAVGLRCAQVLAGLTQALGAVASMAELEQALAGVGGGCGAVGPPGGPIGAVAAGGGGRNGGARPRAGGGFGGWEEVFGGRAERVGGPGGPRPGASPGGLGPGVVGRIGGGMVL